MSISSRTHLTSHGRMGDIYTQMQVLVAARHLKSNQETCCMELLMIQLIQSIEETVLLKSLERLFQMADRQPEQISMGFYGMTVSA